MVSPYLRKKIITLHTQEHLNVEKIAQQTGLQPRTVRKYLISANVYIKHNRPSKAAPANFGQAMPRPKVLTPLEVLQKQLGGVIKTAKTSKRQRLECLRDNLVLSVYHNKSVIPFSIYPTDADSGRYLRAKYQSRVVRFAHKDEVIKWFQTPVEQNVYPVMGIPAEKPLSFVEKVKAAASILLK